MAIAKPPQRALAATALRNLGVRYVLTRHYAGLWLARYGLRKVYGSPEADLWEDPAARPRVYLAGDVQMVDAVDALPMLFQVGLASRSAVLLEREEGTRIVSRPAGGRVAVVRDDATEVRFAIDAAGPAVLVLLDAWSPDWRATVDGRPVEIRHANYLGRAIEVPAGRHDVTFRFSSRSFHVGAAITLLALAAALGWCWRTVWPRLAVRRS